MPTQLPLPMPWVTGDDCAFVCVEALERRAKIAYQWNFVRSLKARLARKAHAYPDVYAVEPLARVWTVRQFDETYTAPHHGFRDASDYYQRASAMRVVANIRVPALILTAEDDPFVPPAPSTSATTPANAIAPKPTCLAVVRCRKMNGATSRSSAGTQVTSSSTVSRIANLLKMYSTRVSGFDR